MKTVVVNADALHRVLNALMGPPHMIHELQAISRMPAEMRGSDPIGTLREEFNRAVAAQSSDLKPEQN